MHGNEGAAVVVDGLRGEREVAVKAPGAFLKGMRFVTGAAALEDGRVALLLSTPDIVRRARAGSRPAIPRGRDRRRLRILLVDDSAIAREAEAALLRSLGPRGGRGGRRRGRLAAAPGRQLPAPRTDVQMPVLDGIDLTRRVKATPRFVKLPIVIMSSLSAPEERRGVDAGADAYIVKGELEAESLAATLERLCGSARGLCHGSAVRVLVADDSALFRELLAGVVADAPGFEVVAVAADGHAAAAMRASTAPT